MSNDKLTKIKTLIWFDVFDWPLTALEIKKYTPTKNLSKLPENASDAIENLNGFYFLKNRSGTTPHQSLRHGTGQASIATPNNAEIVKKRILRQKIAIKKIKIGKFAAEILSFVPFVKMAAICNDLAYFNAPKESDIDFFIIVKSGRIWTTRFLSTAILFVLGLWRHGKKIKDRICLSFFIADDNLNFENIAYEDDVYLKYWILQLLPLFYREGIYQKFLKENSWAIDDFPNFFPNLPSPKILVRQKFFQLIFEKLLSGWLGNLLEKILKTIQIGIMRKKIPYQKNRDVIISNKILKFHENDRRKYFRNTFNQRLMEIHEHS